MAEEWVTVMSTKNKSHAGKAEGYKSTLTGDAGAGKKAEKIAYREQAESISMSLWVNSLRAKVQARESKTRTICVMFYLAGPGRLGYVTSESGFPAEMKAKCKALRDAADANVKNVNYCAEEHVLAWNSGAENDKYLFSIAFDGRGEKPACKKCRKILAMYQIEDLFYLPEGQS